MFAMALGTTLTNQMQDGVGHAPAETLAIADAAQGAGARGPAP